MGMENFKKWEIVLVDLNPVKGKEISKVRPCLIISPTVANKHLDTVIVAPLTSTIRNIPTRLPSNFDGKPGEICFDRLRRRLKICANAALLKAGKFNGG